ncbi:actin maturation protease-like [Clavelina lepadiformis]|uniref:actin maturation protease-like n=1 Tax=Clavelina lepadiformis TaxID=159417 RepID=UPI0040434C43
MQNDVYAQHTNVPRYPAFAFKSAGLVENSKEKSPDEERQLCLKLIEDVDRRQSYIRSPLHWYTFNTPVPSVLQGYRRPMCGLVALSMAGHMLEKCRSSVPQYTNNDILQAAIKLGFTKQGEMFSVYDMAVLARNLYRCEVTIYDTEMKHNAHTILTNLLCGHPLIVPYDNDRNFEPCLQRGHRAHWAIITGAVIGSKKKTFDDNHLQFHKKLPNLVKIIDSQWFQENLADKLALQDGENINTSLIYLYGKQGKSARYRLWSLNSLSTSNSNLKEYDPKRDWNWLHCPYNLEDTLCNKYMVLHF